MASPGKKALAGHVASARRRSRHRRPSTRSPARAQRRTWLTSGAASPVERGFSASQTWCALRRPRGLCEASARSAKCRPGGPTAAAVQLSRRSSEVTARQVERQGFAVPAANPCRSARSCSVQVTVGRGRAKKKQRGDEGRGGTAGVREPVVPLPSGPSGGGAKPTPTTRSRSVIPRTAPRTDAI